MMRSKAREFTRLLWVRKASRKRRSARQQRERREGQEYFLQRRGIWRVLPSDWSFGLFPEAIPKFVI
jgi:hypothetical protein